MNLNLDRNIYTGQQQSETTTNQLQFEQEVVQVMLIHEQIDFHPIEDYISL